MLKRINIASHDDNENCNIETLLLNGSDDYEANENLANFIVILNRFLCDVVTVKASSQG